MSSLPGSEGDNQEIHSSHERNMAPRQSPGMADNHPGHTSGLGMFTLGRTGLLQSLVVPPCVQEPHPILLVSLLKPVSILMSSLCPVQFPGSGSLDVATAQF